MGVGGAVASGVPELGVMTGLKRVQFGGQLAVLPRLGRLALEGAQAWLKLGEHIGQPVQIAFSLT